MSFPTQNNDDDIARAILIPIDVAGAQATDYGSFDLSKEEDEAAASVLDRLDSLKSARASLLPPQTDLVEDQRDRDRLATYLEGLTLLGRVISKHYQDRSGPLSDAEERTRKSILNQLKTDCESAEGFIERIPGRCETETGYESDQTVNGNDSGRKVTDADSDKAKHRLAGGELSTTSTAEVRV